MTKLNSILAGLVAAIGVSAASAQEVTRFVELGTAVSTKSRAEVLAGASGIVHEGNVTRFAIVLDGPSAPRAQVLAEAREAMRLGLLSRGETNVVFTPAQAERIRVAGLRAVTDMPVAQSR